jgi:putative transposase
VIGLLLMICVKYPLSLRNVEDLLHARGIDIRHETVRLRWNRPGPMFAAEIRRKRVERMRSHTHWTWRLDEVQAQIKGQMRSLWRAADHEGETLAADAGSRRREAGDLRLRFRPSGASRRRPG